MTRLRCLLGVCAVLGAAIVAAPATADPFVGPPICSSAGTAVSGVYAGNLKITGNAYVPEGRTLVVRGNLEIARGACLDAFSVSTVHVRGNVFVARGAVLGLGCGPGAIGPMPPCNMTSTHDTVDGSIIARNALTMYITAVRVHGNLTSTGGGPGPTFNPYINFPIKDSVIDGNLRVTGWQGAWFGALRNTVGGNVYIHKDVGVATAQDGSLDSTEIATNTIAGNLVCTDNTPHAQIGDSGGSLNTVGGQKIGECTKV